MKTPKFTNTQLLTQINWNEEIANETFASEDDMYQRASEAVFNWTMIEDLINDHKSKSDSVPANLVRMAEYFFGKFIYMNTMVYNKDGDVKDSLKQIPYISKLKKEFGKIERSKLPIAKLREVEEMLSEVTRKRRAKEIPKDGYYEEGKQLLEKAGVEVFEPSWHTVSKSSDRDEYHFKHEDGTIYHMYVLRGGRTFAKVKQDVAEKREAIKRYHEIIKPVYDHVKNELGVNDLWVMAGGGGQTQFFFGDGDKGYLAIMYMDMRSSKVRPGLDKLKTYSLLPQGKRGDDLFENFKMDGVKINFCRDIYKDNLEAIGYGK